MPSEWTLKQGIDFAQVKAKTIKPKVRRKVFNFKNSDVPHKWTTKHIQWLNHLAWALLRTPLRWDAIEVVWTVYIMTMPWWTSLNGASHLNFPHLLHNLFDWLFWDSPEEGMWVPGLTFDAFNVEWRDVDIESFDENSSKEEQEEAMQAFIDIWLEGQRLSENAPNPPSAEDKDPEYQLYRHVKYTLVTDEQHALAANQAKEYLDKKLHGKGPVILDKWGVDSEENTASKCKRAASGSSKGRGKRARL